MNHLCRRILIMLFCLTTGGVALSAQWDPHGDERLFTYVFPYPGHYINDHCLIRVDSLWHLYFIDGTPGGEKWSRPGNEVRIGHATSPDLLKWTPHDSALGIGAPGSLDMAHVYAPSVIERNGTYYMFYTGNEVGYGDGEHIFLATSTDLYSWRRYRQEPIFLPDTSWAAYHPPGYAASSGGPLSCRDPFVVYDERYGYILYYVAKLRSKTSNLPDGTESCIAAMTSPDLINWTDRGPLVVRKTLQLEQGTTWNHPESPCLVRRGGSHYLFWKGGPGTRYLKSDDPLDFAGATEYRLATSHASKVFDWNDAWYITSCSRDVSDVAHEFNDRTRGLYLAGLIWENDHPRVTPLDPTTRVPRSASWPGAMAVAPNPVERGRSILLRLSSGSYVTRPEVDVSDARGVRIFRAYPAAVVDEDGSQVVEIPTDELMSGVYFIRIGTEVACLVVL